MRLLQSFALISAVFLSSILVGDGCPRAASLDFPNQQEPIVLPRNPIGGGACNSNDCLVVRAQTCNDCLVVRVQTEDKRGAPLMRSVGSPGQHYFIAFYVYVDATPGAVHLVYHCDETIGPLPTLTDTCLNYDDIPKGFKGVQYRAFEQAFNLNLDEQIKDQIVGTAVAFLRTNLANKKIDQELGSAKSETSLIIEPAK